jgi:hypothetical protein
MERPQLALETAGALPLGSNAMDRAKSAASAFGMCFTQRKSLRSGGARATLDEIWCRSDR